MTSSTNAKICDAARSRASAPVGAIQHLGSLPTAAKWSSHHRPFDRICWARTRRCRWKSSRLPATRSSRIAPARTGLDRTQPPLQRLDLASCEELIHQIVWSTHALAVARSTSRLPAVTRKSARGTPKTVRRFGSCACPAKFWCTSPPGPVPCDPPPRTPDPSRNRKTTDRALSPKVISAPPRC